MSDENVEDKLIFWETTSKFLIYDRDSNLLEGQVKDKAVPDGVKAKTMNPDPK